MPSETNRNNNPSPNPDRGPRPDQKGYSTSEAIIALKDELIGEAKANRQQPNTKNKTNWIEIITLFLLFCTTGGLVIQDVILHSSDTTFKDTLRNQRESNERQLRAYVGFLPGAVEDFGITGKWRVRFGRKNFGQTPAYDVGVTNVGFDIIKYGEAVAAGPVLCVKPNMRDLFTLFPSSDLPLTVRIGQKDTVAEKPIFDPAMVELVKKGERQFVYWGTVCYNDVFGKPHFTNYCWMYSGKDMTAADAEGCLGHNDSN